jgi:hypothetical protein
MTKALVGSLREALQASRPITRSKYATELASLPAIMNIYGPVCDVKKISRKKHG